jgi:polysaccharide biosynthesis transport protein
MTFTSLFRLLVRNFKWLFPMGFISAVTVFYSTKDTPKEYESHTTINTGLVSGYNIESQKGGKIDFGYANAEMENILNLARSRETQEELAARLLAQALMQRQPSTTIITETAFNALKKDIPQNIRDKFVNYHSFENTLSRVKALRDKTDKNLVKALLESKHPLFGIEHINLLTIKREGNSDIIRLGYSTTDPAVCRNTLMLLTEIFISKHRSNKEGQSSDVVGFFEKSTKESSEILGNKEGNMLSYMVDNKIINYYEQTRFIAAKKEDLDEMYFKEMMQLAAADSARRNLEKQLTKYVSIPVINKNLVKQRTDLSDVSVRLANLELTSLNDSTAQPDAGAVAQLQKQSERIKKDLRQQAEATYAMNRTFEGVEVKNVLNQWLNQFVEVEQSLARVRVFKERKSEFDKLYAKYAPLGSNIKRMEREIDISEKAYLENLHSYNEARLHQYNTLMTANLRVVDAPYYPDKPKPSKRMMLVIMGFMAGFVLLLVGFIVRELLDKSLKTPENAIESTGLELHSAFPKLPHNWENMEDAVVDYKALMQKAANLLIQNIKVDLRDSNRPLSNPPHIAVVGTRGGEGKSFIIDYLTKNKEGFTYTELPALLSEHYTADLEVQYDFVLVIVNANYTWFNADKKAVNVLAKVTNCTCRMALNNVDVEDLESSLGEIPKKRKKPLERAKRYFDILKDLKTKSDKALDAFYAQKIDLKSSLSEIPEQPENPSEGAKKYVDILKNLKAKSDKALDAFYEEKINK